MELVDSGRSRDDAGSTTGMGPDPVLLPDDAAAPAAPRTPVFLQACCLSVMVAVICGFLGDPCAHNAVGVVVLDSLPVFRCTCLGFGTFTIIGAALPWRRLSDLCFRIAIIFNSLAFWWVTFTWCMDITYVWWCIFILEHMFIVFFLLVILRGKGMLAHLAFSTAGALTGFERASRQPDHEMEEIWKTGVLIAVSMLVASSLALLLLDVRATGSREGLPRLFASGRRIAPAEGAEGAAPEPREAQAWAGVVPAAGLRPGAALLGVPADAGVAPTDPATCYENSDSTRPTRPPDGGSATEGPTFSTRELPCSTEGSVDPVSCARSVAGASDAAQSGLDFAEYPISFHPDSQEESDSFSDADHTLQIPLSMPWASSSETSSVTGVVRRPSMTSEYARQSYTSEDMSTTGDCKSTLGALTASVSNFSTS